MEFYGCRWLEACCEQSAECLEKIDSASTIIICTGSTPVCGAAQVDGVHMSAENGHRASGGTRDTSDDRALDPGVREC